MRMRLRASSWQASKARWKLSVSSLIPPERYTCWSHTAKISRARGLRAVQSFLSSVDGRPGCHVCRILCHSQYVLGRETLHVSRVSRPISEAYQACHASLICRRATEEDSRLQARGQPPTCDKWMTLSQTARTVQVVMGNASLLGSLRAGFVGLARGAWRGACTGMLRTASAAAAAAAAAAGSCCCCWVCCLTACIASATPACIASATPRLGSILLRLISTTLPRTASNALVIMLQYVHQSWWSCRARGPRDSRANNTACGTQASPSSHICQALTSRGDARRLMRNT